MIICSPDSDQRFSRRSVFLQHGHVSDFRIAPYSYLWMIVTIPDPLNSVETLPCTRGHLGSLDASRLSSPPGRKAASPDASCLRDAVARGRCNRPDCASAQFCSDRAHFGYPPCLARRPGAMGGELSMEGMPARFLTELCLPAQCPSLFLALGTFYLWVYARRSSSDFRRVPLDVVTAPFTEAVDEGDVR